MAKLKPFFDEVDTKVDFPSLEKEIYKYWEKNKITEKYLNKNKTSKKIFSFLDGPITANNAMGIHHAWGRTYKDLWQKYKNMQGFKQRFQNGFDCQGLWVEVEVEKELGLKNKQDIENLIPGDPKKSIAKFVELCKERVLKYADIQTEQSQRLGYFMDWDNSYFTLSDENNFMIWHFLKKCHERGLIYKGRDSVPWCPRCGTAISQHEMLTEDYKQLTHQALFVAYPLPGKKGEYLLIWTTTPWTLPANVACAVDPKINYVVAKEDESEKKYYLAETRAKALNLKVIKKLKGKELIGMKYLSPFDHLPRVKEAFGKYQHKIVSSDERILPVDESEGTGVVHLAPGVGSEDFALGKKEKLPVLAVIDEEAKYLEGLGEFSGKNAKKNPDLIINFLKNKGFLFKQEKYKHKYPVCWRCKEELVWRVVDEWYISIDPVRNDMKKVARKIKWIPSFGLKRELDWLNNMHDWLISKKRFWGLAIPIWECGECRHFEVIGSYKELKSKAVSGWSKFEGHSPHRPWIDEVTIKCSQCGKLAKRIPDVGNPWLDAGIVTFSTVTHDNKGKPLYLADKKEWEKWIPADFITESFPGQFKNWFYSLIAMSTVLENKEPFKEVLGFATLFGEDGKAMHKSSSNMIEFREGADKIGVDVMRWMYIKQNPSENLLFGYKKADETRRRFHLRLWNIYNFFITYATLDNFKPGKNFKPNSKNKLDVWILSRLNQAISGVTERLERFDAYRASALIDEFVEDFSTWYIRRSRERVSPASKNNLDKRQFYQTTYFVLTSLVKLLAPFTPYLSEVIYQNLTKEESVHLTDWPKAGKVNEKLIIDMKIIREIVEDAHSIRKEKQIPVRQPLLSLSVEYPGSVPEKTLHTYIKDEVNVKNISIKKGSKLKSKLDTNITPELKEEAKARELIRNIQVERKNMGVNLTQKINVLSPWIPLSNTVIQKVKDKTLTENLAKGKFRVTKSS